MTDHLAGRSEWPAKACRYSIGERKEYCSPRGEKLQMSALPAFN